MAPRYFHPEAWLAVLENLPRGAAFLLLLLAGSMLVLGLRWFRYYVLAAVAVTAWASGMLLSRPMQVTGWYVAAAAALIAVGVLWPLAAKAEWVLVPFVSACGCGTMVGGVLGQGFWPAFVGGALAGLVLVIIAPRFSVALFCATSGAAIVLASLGASVRASQGVFAPGAYERYPLLFLGVGAVLVIAAMIVQVLMEPDIPPMQDPKTP